MAAVDTVRRVETPEGVELALRPAGPVARALALLVDQVIVWSGIMLSLLALGPLGAVGLGLWIILLFLAQWLYPVFFEVLGSGRTLGKRWLGLRVLQRDGLPITWGPSLLRNLLRFVDALPFAYTVGLFSVLITRDFQRVGDLVAGTLVVHDPPPPRRLQDLDAPALPPPVALGLQEQEALLAFAERTPHFSPARAQEMADLLEPLTGLRGEPGLQDLRGMARHLRGGV